MKNLMRAIRMAFKYKYSLVSSMVLGFLVAALWGANITALYPFVEIVFEGDSLHGWVDGRVEEANDAIARNEEKIGELREEYEAAEPDRQRSINQHRDESFPLARSESHWETRRTKVPHGRQYRSTLTLTT